MICDNLAAHQAPAVQRWLLAPPGAAALHPDLLLLVSQAGRWFAEPQRRCLDRGVFCSLDEPTIALADWIKTWHASARPFRWTKTAGQIIGRICRYCSRIPGPGHLVSASRHQRCPCGD